jgi:murein DD-endopeptidase MepM/ murein hydrolase activator NlpD
MKIILVAGSSGRSRAISLGRWTRAALSACVFGLPLGAGVAVGYGLGNQQHGDLNDDVVEALRERVRLQQHDLASSRDAAERQLQALAVRTAELQARVLRLDAVGERVAGAAELDISEFEFDAAPALGGPAPEQETMPVMVGGDVAARIDQLQEQLDARERQFGLLDDLLAARQLEHDFVLSGRPVRHGWISSFYGHRADPFNGRPTMHRGVDFAGKAGSDVLAVGAGVVAAASRRSGYGNLVEIRHTDGFVTRYAHNQKLLVKPGDVVRKGQVIALMGSSGRSTAPHVHFEVYRHGRSIDPSTYLHYAGR